MTKHPGCWCGNTDLAEFSPDYYRCAVCETLVVKVFPQANLAQIQDEESDLYGANYAERHLQQDYGLPDFARRIRSDLPERCPYWLRTLLKYKLPPAELLELGSFHGGFVGLAQLAGYRARGLDLSPSLGRQASARFGVEILAGPLEQQKLVDGSLDVIALFDVLEHLQDPRSTLETCRKILRQDGVLMIQTPRYQEKRTFAEIKRNEDMFLVHFKPVEHLYLFSQSAVQQLLQEVGFKHVTFEKPIFDQYDMFPISSAKPLATVPVKKADKALLGTSNGRMALALLDATALAARYTQESITANQRLAKMDVEMSARLDQIHTLTKLARTHEQFAADAAAQIKTLTELAQRHQHDAEERWIQIQQLEGWVAARDAELQDLRGQVAKLTMWLKQAEVEKATVIHAHREAEKTVEALKACQSPRPTGNH